MTHGLVCISSLCVFFDLCVFFRGEQGVESGPTAAAKYGGKAGGMGKRRGNIVTAHRIPGIKASLLKEDKIPWPLGPHRSVSITCPAHCYRTEDGMQPEKAEGKPFTNKGRLTSAKRSPDAVFRDPRLSVITLCRNFRPGRM